jgi:endonuclease/exonuclease/phosphatase family metal-dependent hydrolase
MGLAIMSKYPIVNVTRLSFASPGWHHDLDGKNLSEHPKGAIVASIRMPHKIMRVACLHLLPPHIFELSESSRQASSYLERCLKSLLEFAPQLDVIAGDFNSELNGPELKKWGFFDCASGHVTRDSGRSHDNIGVRGGLQFHGLEVFSTGSDHHVLVCDFQF